VRFYLFAEILPRGVFVVVVCLGPFDDSFREAVFVILFWALYRVCGWERRGVRSLCQIAFFLFLRGVFGAWSSNAFFRVSFSFFFYFLFVWGWGLLRFLMSLVYVVFLSVYSYTFVT